MHYVAAMLFFVVFGNKVVRWIDGSETCYLFWLFSGKVEVLAAFGALSVLALFAYWSRLGRALIFRVGLNCLCTRILGARAVSLGSDRVANRGQRAIFANIRNNC